MSQANISTSFRGTIKLTTRLNKFVCTLIVQTQNDREAVLHIYKSYKPQKIARQLLIGIMFHVITLTAAKINAQVLNPVNVDSLETRMSYYDKEKNTGPLFVHFDKNIYAVNENVWLTAYLLKDIYSEKESFISVALTDAQNQVKSQARFVMLNGISSGKMLLPDSLKAGSYHFIVCYGDLTKPNTGSLFVQPVTIKRPATGNFRTMLAPYLSPVSSTNDSQQVRLTVNSIVENTGVADIPVYYSIGKPDKPLYSGKSKTNKAGECLLTIPSIYLTNENHTLQLEIKTINETKQLTYTFPGFDKSISARFYPEGGSLSEGIINRVGWEVKDEKGMALKVTGVLYKNNDSLDIISTNKTGLGNFRFIPEVNNRYYVRLLYSNDKNATYELPAVLINRPVIAIANAITNDTLSFVLKNRRPGNFHVIIHNYRQLFFSFPVQADVTGRLVKIALTDLPKGLAEITILDSLERPCVQRLFFAHYDLVNRLSIQTDQSLYKRRKKVLVDIRLKAPDGKPITGLVSIACIQANRVSPGNFKRIDSYTLLTNELGYRPFSENFMANLVEDKDLLEEILLVKGWRNYSWAALNRTTSADTIVKKEAAILTGIVSRYDKLLKKPVSVIMLKDGALATIESNPDGKFWLGMKDLLVTAGKKIQLFIAGSNREEYKISITDPFQRLIDSLPREFFAGSLSTINNDDSHPTEEVQFGEMISLQEVKVRSRSDHSFYGSSKTQNACGDYVCMYGFLNCPLHRNDAGNKSPEKGKIYKNYLSTDANGKESFTETLYSGCEAKNREYLKSIDGISFPVEFYPADYERDPVTEPQFLSTLFWKNIYKIPEGDAKPLTFYTGDITGDFKIIVQGVTDDDVIYGQQTFKVSE